MLYSTLLVTNHINHVLQAWNTTSNVGRKMDSDRMMKLSQQPWNISNTSTFGFSGHDAVNIWDLTPHKCITNTWYPSLFIRLYQQVLPCSTNPLTMYYETRQPTQRLSNRAARNFIPCPMYFNQTNGKTAAQQALCGCFPVWMLVLLHVPH